jgi:PAS domain S-box-containing protein
MDLSGELAKTLLELAPDATVVVDNEGVIVFANAQIAQTFGYSPTELIGRSVETLLPERFRAAHPRHRAAFSTKPRSRPMGASLSLSGLHKNGREFPVEISLSPVRTGAELLVVGAIRDATLRRDAENLLVEANRAKSRFLAAASHDLRQPLQTLNLLNRVAVRQTGGNATLHGLLDRQQRALDSMSALLASVLDISKLDSGAVAPDPVVCPLAEVLERLRSDFEPQAADRGLTLTIAPTDEAADTDPELLRRLLGNLLSNAIRYTDHGSVAVSCSAQGSVLYIEVRDTGVGIDAGQLERIFEEFYQVDRGAQRPEGLGLGLSIVRRLSALLGSTVTVESALGEGTAFTVRVPRGRMLEDASAATPPATPRSDGHVLIIDDEPAVAEATSMLLELEGFAVDIASSRSEAIEHARTRPPDIILSDFHLRGGETGAGVVTAIRELLGRSVPTIFVTGDTGKSALAAALDERTRVLSKPVRADELLAAVRQSLAALESRTAG